LYWIPGGSFDTANDEPVPVNGVCVSNLKTVIKRYDSAFGEEIYKRINPAARKYLGAYSPRIGLSTNFLYHFLQPGLRTENRCADMRFQLVIAKTLCHELCHTLYAGRGLGNDKEPHVFLHDQILEVGLSWDFYLGGARMQLRSGKNYIGRLEARTWQFMNSHPDIGVPIPMEWVEPWFRKDTWEAEREEFRTKNLWGTGPEDV
jgi:hypothetical protein